MKVVIMAGGKGTRIASVRSDVPKPMIPICGKPILEHQIDNLKSCGLTDIILVIGYLGDKIQEYFGDGSKFGVNIEYFVEDHPLGTAGALFKMPQLTEDFLLLCGDVIIDVDFNRFIALHKEHKAWASLVAHPNGHPYDSSLLVTEIEGPKVPGGMPEDTHRVIRWMAKEDERTYYKNRVNAGIEIISPELLKETMKHFVPRHPETPDKIDLDRDVLKPNIPSGRIYAYDTPEYIKDMGTPDRYYETEKDIVSGKVHARNLKNNQKAIFLDRDGTINVTTGFLTSADQFELIEGAAEAIKTINKSGYLAIVVTNQPVIARGECTFEELQRIHDKMETELGKAGAFVDAIYVCPHHTDKGFEGERPEYKCNCDCRKPKPGLLLQAAKDFNIDLSESYMIGDSHRDVEAGENAGVKASILIEGNKGGALMEALNAYGITGSQAHEDSVHLLNVRIDNLTAQELLEKLKKGVLVTPNIDDIMKHQHDREFHECASQAEFSVCDSKVVKLMSAIKGTPLKEAIPGSSFFPMYCDYHAKDENVKIFLLGAKEGVADVARDKINKHIGREIIVGTYSPPFGFEKDESECRHIVEILRNSTANVVLVGLGNPKQTKWIYKYKNHLPNIDVFMALGATIDFEAGNIKRAPAIFQKLALEWLYRFCKEPKRLFKRYFVDDMQFFWYFGKQLLGMYKDPFQRG